VEKTYKHKPIYLVAKEGSEIKGVLPLFMIRSWFFDRKLVSVPFAPYGGVCADNETEEHALCGKAYMSQQQITKYAAYIHGPAHEFPERLEER